MDGIRKEFENYFDCGFGIKESIEYHETKLEIKFGENSDQLANSSYNPKYRTVNYWYELWRKRNLGSRDEIGVVEVPTCCT